MAIDLTGMVRTVGAATLSFAVLTFAFASAGTAGEGDMLGQYYDEKADVRSVAVSDRAGHTIGSFSTTGIFIAPEGTGTRYVSGTFDFVDGTGPQRGHAIHVYADGSTQTIRWQGESKANAAGERVSVGTYSCVSGTGRLKSIKCEGTWTHALGANGMGIGEYSGTMTLPD